MSELGEVVLTVDEFESVRLSDFEGLYHASAAERMDVSRQTFGRIISSARRKVAEALVEGKALRIDGGEFRTSAMRLFECEPCGNIWEVPQGTGRPADCPQCHGEKIRRANKPERQYKESVCRYRVREYPPEE